MKILTRATLVVMFVLVSAYSICANPNIDKKTIAYINSSGFHQELYDLGIYWDRNILKIETECSSKYYINPLSFSILDPIMFSSGQEHPQKGVWTQRFNFKRCDESITYNALVVAQKGQKPKMAALVPGNTYCSPQLLRDLFAGGVGPAIAVKGRSKENCKDIQVRDTQLTMEPTTLEKDGKEIAGAWEEKWTVKYCEEDIEMTFCFLPDGNGGTSWVSGGCAK